MTHSLIRSLLVTCVASFLIQPLDGSTDVSESDIDRVAASHQPITIDTFTNIPFYSADNLPVTAADDHSNPDIQITPAQPQPSISITPPDTTTLPPRLDTEAAQSKQPVETVTPRATAEIPSNSSLPPESTTIPATTTTPGVTLTTSGLCYETTAAETPCSPVILGKKQLRELYNSRVVKAQRYIRPKDFCVWRFLKIKLHCGVVVTLEKAYRNVSRWLIHKGLDFGKASETVVVDARCMSAHWRLTTEKIITKSTVSDYVKAAGPNYSLLCDNCRDACNRMMKLD